MCLIIIGDHKIIYILIVRGHGMRRLFAIFVCCIGYTRGVELVSYYYTSYTMHREWYLYVINSVYHLPSVVLYGDIDMLHTNTS
jgi:hypothetical protein